eukprot:GSA25T00016369001.1
MKNHPKKGGNFFQPVAASWAEVFSIGLLSVCSAFLAYPPKTQSDSGRAFGQDSSGASVRGGSQDTQVSILQCLLNPGWLQDEYAMDFFHGPSLRTEVFFVLRLLFSNAVEKNKNKKRKPWSGAF